MVFIFFQGKGEKKFKFKQKLDFLSLKENT